MLISKRKKRIVLAVLGLLLFGGLALLLWAFVIEPGRVTVKETTIQIPGWPQDSTIRRMVLTRICTSASPHIDLEKLRRDRGARSMGSNPTYHDRRRFRYTGCAGRRFYRA